MYLYLYITTLSIDRYTHKMKEVRDGERTREEVLLGRVNLEEVWSLTRFNVST